MSVARGRVIRGVMWIPLAAPLAAAWLAPGPVEWASANAELTERMARVEAASDALGALHGALGERLATGARLQPCDDPAVGSLVARSRAFGAAYRDATQDARVQVARVAELAEAPTVSPLLQASDRSALAHAQAAIDAHVAAYLEAASWQAKYVEPTAKGCPLTLAASDGLPWMGPTARGERPVYVAWIATGGGVACPAGLPANGQVRWASSEGVCVQAAAPCGCAPNVVAPGAVLTAP